MRIAFLDKPEWSRGTPLEAFAEWAAENGHSVRWSNPDAPESAIDADLVAAYGLYGTRARIAETARIAGLPVLVFDGGYFCRDRYFRVCLNQMEWLYPQECTSERFDSLGFALTNERKEDGYILLADQSSANDTLVYRRDELNAYPAKAIAALRKATKREIVLRTHPQMPTVVTDFDGRVHDGREVPENESLAGAYAVCSHSSNLGNAALLRGIHVFTERPTAMAGLENTDLKKIEKPKAVTDSERQAYFNRLARTQWTLDEIRSGQTWSAIEEFVFPKSSGAIEDETAGLSASEGA